MEKKGKKKIEDLNFTKLTGIAEYFELKEYTKHRSKSDLLQYIQENVPEKKIDNKLNPERWKWDISKVGSWASIVGLFLAVITIIWDPLDWFRSCSPVKAATLQPFFSPADSTSFNVLILRFENLVDEDENTWRIGRSIKDLLSVIEANDSLIRPIKAHYVEKIPPPEDVASAKRTLKHNFADLIIYGFANDVTDSKPEMKISFRYNIAERVVAPIDPFIDVKTSKHRLDYSTTDPIELQRGEFKVDNVPLKYWIGSLLNAKAGNEEEAYLELDKIAADTSLDKIIRAERYAFIGNNYADYRNYDHAIEAYDLAIGLNSEYRKFYYLRGDAYSDNGEYDEALGDFNRAIELDPGYKEAYNHKGTVYYDQRKYKEANIEYSVAIALDSNYAFPYNNTGNIFNKQGKFKQAINYFNKAIELDSNYVFAYNNRGNANRRSGEHDLAIVDYDKAIELNPEYANAYNNRGIAFYHKRDYDQAILNYNKAVDLDPEHRNAYRNRGRAYQESKKYNLAIKDFSKAIELDPKYVNGYSDRGLIYNIQKKYKKSIEDYSKAIELMPNNPIAFNNRGNSFYELKIYPKAIEDYTKAIELNPNYFRAYSNRSNTYRKQGKIELAKIDAQKSFTINKKYGWAYAILAMIYADEGKVELFYQYMEIAISKPIAYPLKAGFEEEETLQRFKGEERFEELLRRAKE